MKNVYFLTQSLFQDNEFSTFDMKEAVAWCKTQKVLAVDTETIRNVPKNKYDETVYKPGLDPYFSKICLFQIGNHERKYIVDSRYFDITPFKEILESDTILKVLHNAKFDAKMLLRYNIKLHNIWDTMLCEKILTNGENISYNLEAIGKKHGFIKTNEVKNLFTEEIELTEEENDLDFDLLDGKEEAIYVDKTIRTLFVEWGDKSFTVEQIIYAANDLDIPLKLYEMQLKGKSLNGEIWLPLKAFDIENKFAVCLAEIENNGLLLDVIGWKQMYEDNKKIYVEKKLELNNYIENFHPKFASTIDLFTSKPACTIEWSSPKQVINFFRSLNICPKERSKSTGKIEWSVGAKSIFKLLNNENKDKFFSGESLPLDNDSTYQNLMLNFLLLKKYQMLTTTFGLKFLRFVHPITGKIHCSFRQFMNTGRMSSTNPNSQNLPNGQEWRKLFIAPKNKKMVAIDFKSQELRYLSILANIKNMKDFFINDHPVFKDDFHSFSATNMFRIVRNDKDLIIDKVKHKKERTISKALTFGINYGKSAYSVSKELGISEEEANLFIDGFLDGFPGLRENFEIRKKEALKNGWIEISPYSKKKYFYPDFNKLQANFQKGINFLPENWNKYSLEQKAIWKSEEKIRNPEYGKIWKEYSILRGKLERRALNYPIQGGCSELSKVAATLMMEKGLYLVNIIHD